MQNEVHTRMFVDSTKRFFFSGGNDYLFKFNKSGAFTVDFSTPTLR
jgi:hypothetical protein